METQDILFTIVIVGWFLDNVLAEVNIPQNSTWQIIKSILKALASMKGGRHG